MKRQYLYYLIFILSGLFLGWLIFKEPHERNEQNQHSDHNGFWTCSMHPQIKTEQPGKCPICGMNLIPLITTIEAADSGAIKMTAEAIALANITTSVVSIKNPEKIISLNGIIKADERKLQSQIAQFPGRIEKLYISFTGERVTGGQSIARIYSPELLTVQQELREAAIMKQTNPEIYNAIKLKLNQWKLTDEQLIQLESSDVVNSGFDIKANTTGTVIKRYVNTGDYVSRGTVLFDIADLSSVWALFDAYESDLSFLKQGDEIEFTVQALPGEKFKGIISNIDPFLDPSTRVARVRVQTNNESGKLKPEMFTNGRLKTKLNRYGEKIVIPASAVLWTGKRSLVYVKQKNTDEPVFKMREIELGPSLADSYVVLNGLVEGEEIVTQGTFSVDAASQLEGKPSMMNR